MSDTTAPARRLHYAWVMAAVTFLILLVGAGIRATPGVLIVPLREEFGWSTEIVSRAVAMNILLYGLLGPFAVAVYERFGLRRTIGTALLLLAGGVGATALMRHPWQLMLLWGLVVGSGTGMVAIVLGATVANRWFHERRGLVLGVLTASSATGQLVFLPFLASLAVHHGWRAVSCAVALAALALLPLTWLLRDSPAQLGLAPLGGVMQPATPAGINPARRAINALRTGLRSPDFWLLAGSFFVCGASSNGLIGTHLIPICVDHGIPEVQAAGLLAMMGVFDLFGTTASGWLTDRFDSRVLLSVYYGLRGLSLIALPFCLDHGQPSLFLFAAFYGLDWIATVPPTVRLAEHSFGRADAPLMFGWIGAAHQLGGASAAWLSGLVRSSTGNYMDALIATGLVCLAASLMVMAIGRTRAGNTEDAQRWAMR